jgi:hypothetical protein
LLLLGDEIGSGTRSDLVRQMADDPTMRRHVLELWRMAVNDQGVVRSALDLLATWIKDADPDPDSDLTRACRWILRALVRDRTGREQLGFHLRIWRAAWISDYPNSQRLLDEELPVRGTRQ